MVTHHRMHRKGPHVPAETPGLYISIPITFLNMMAVNVYAAAFFWKRQEQTLVSLERERLLITSAFSLFVKVIERRPAPLFTAAAGKRGLCFAAGMQAAFCRTFEWISLSS